MAFLIGATTYKGIRGGYSGYMYDEEAAVIPLLGKDPAQTDRNEAIQTSAKRSQVCTLDVYADTIAERDALISKLYTQTTHDDGSGDPVRNVTVIAVRARIRIWYAFPRWAVELKMRTR